MGEITGVPETVMLPSNSVPATNGNGKTGHAKASTAYSNAKELQRLILNDARDPELKPVARAAIARAFCELENLKLRIKMKPLPGSLRPTSAKPQRRQSKPRDPEPVQEAPAVPDSVPPSQIAKETEA